MEGLDETRIISFIGSMGQVFGLIELQGLHHAFMLRISSQRWQGWTCIVQHATPHRRTVGREYCDCSNKCSSTASLNRHLLRLNVTWLSIDQYTNTAPQDPCELLDPVRPQFLQWFHIANTDSALIRRYNIKPLLGV